MRLITKETDYAIRAVMHLARNPETYVSSARISAEEKIPLQFLRRILRRLLKAGVVLSREGVAGGVSLNARPEDLQLLRILEIFQGQVEISECMFRKRICANRSTCILRKQIKQIEAALTAQFAGITIANLLRGQACKPASSRAADRPARTRARRRGSR
jgi:Rrf2 family cysteine metabolism transcriptional repressor